MMPWIPRHAPPPTLTNKQIWDTSFSILSTKTQKKSYIENEIFPRKHVFLSKNKTIQKARPVSMPSIW